MTINQNTVVKYLSLLLMTIFTIVELLQKQTTVFYIIYLFWFDEFIRTVFDRIRYYFKKNTIENPVEYLRNNKDRFFLLSMYFIFIIIFFGCIIDWKQSDLIGNNFNIFYFKNAFFNYSLLTFIIREYYLQQKDTIKKAKNVFSSGILILHISIVFGLSFWFLSTQKMEFMKAYANILAIVPFLILKLVFEIYPQRQPDVK